ncbi:hypothetical protein U9M48_021396 [Paspalum notatum var. saurae]|uniref:SMP-LTD domain-containing protein n=1 Tax=Paspalum notatum var. saurae TaxID=547442 RepID=A0AAQ3WTY5_PASNO
MRRRIGVGESLSGDWVGLYPTYPCLGFLSLLGGPRPRPAQERRKRGTGGGWEEALHAPSSTRGPAGGGGGGGGAAAASLPTILDHSRRRVLAGCRGFNPDADPLRRHRAALPRRCRPLHVLLLSPSPQTMPTPSRPQRSGRLPPGRSTTSTPPVPTATNLPIEAPAPAPSTSAVPFTAPAAYRVGEDPLISKLRTQLGVIHPLPAPPISRPVIGLFALFFFVGAAFDKLWTLRKRRRAERELKVNGSWPQVPTASFSLFLEDKDLQRKESVEWVNMVLGKLWKVYRTGIENWIVGLLQPVIDNLQKPDYVNRVEIRQFYLGEEPLSVRNVERRTSRRANDLQYQIGIRYAGGARMALALSLKFSKVPVVVPVWVRDFDIDGELWVKLRLIPTEPWVGAVSWAFVSLPKITFELSLFRLFNLMVVPVPCSAHRFITDIYASLRFSGAGWLANSLQKSEPCDPSQINSLSKSESYSQSQSACFDETQIKYPDSD